MVLTVIGWIAVAASAVCLLLANRMSQREITREGIQILCSLVLCFVGTALISNIHGVETAFGGYHRPWRIIGFVLLLIALLLWRLSKRIQ